MGDARPGLSLAELDEPGVLLELFATAYAAIDPAVRVAAATEAAVSRVSLCIE